MFLIQFIFKIIISIIIGYISGYNFKNEKKEDAQPFLNSLICLFGAIFSLIFTFNENNLVALSITNLGLFYFILNITKKDNFFKRCEYLLSLALGVLIGTGYFIPSIVLLLIYVYLANNIEILSKILSSKIDINKIKNDENINTDDFELDDFNKL